MKIYGYYDDPKQTEPKFDPGLPCNCLFCNKQVDEDHVRTIGIMALPEDGTKAERSYFYRVHRDCHERASEAQKQNIDELVFRQIRANKD